MAGETIAAIATPVGVGGVGVIRLSGPEAAAIAAGLISKRPRELPDRQMVYGVARSRAGERLDDVLVVVMRAPRSYTGEDVAEVHGHGGAVNLRRLLREILSRGAAAAEPGQFTRRAFENGKIDLARAEALLGVIEAGSERAWRLAQAQLAGTLGARVAELRSRGTELLAEVEACIDFPEDDVDFLRANEAESRAGQLAAAIDRLAATYVLGQAVREGIEVAIVGPVNAGKSSLFNRLLGEERAIVTAEPGTTRDFVEARTVWEGIPVTLVDTAGQREGAGSDAEAIGQSRGRARAEAADLRIDVRAADEAGDDEPGAERTVRVLAKIDRAPDANVPAGWLATSAVTGAGLADVKAAVLEAVLGSPAEEDEGVVVTTERQRAVLEDASSAFARGAVAVRDGVPTEMVALELREGCDALAGLTGERVGEEMLDALFAQFCIGK